jgi:hypothetical protein
MIHFTCILPSSAMPRKSDCQQMTDALLDAFIIQMVAEAEIAAYCDHSDSDSESSDSESDTSSSSDSMEVDDGVTDALLESLAELHCT